jgi:hypothetical protein
MNEKISNLFADLSALRLDQSSGDIAVKSVITIVPARKPNRVEFFRVHPDENYRLTTTILIDDQRDVYIIPVAARGVVLDLGDIKPVQLLTCVNRRNDPFIWPLPLPTFDGRTNAWHSSAREAAAMAEKQWIRLVPDMSAGFYKVYAAQGEFDAPQFPEIPFNELLQKAFTGRVIDSADHPVIRALRGM